MTRMPRAVAAAMRAADGCARCGHRRDVHTREKAECRHVQAAGRGRAAAGRCACRRFATATRRKRRGGRQ